MRIVDFHTHIYPEAIALKASRSIADFYEIDGGLKGTADILIERGSKAGIEKYVVLPVAIKAEHVRHINENILKEVALHNEFIGFGTVHAGMENILEEAEYIEKNGLMGIKMHPDTQLFSIDDKRLFPLYDAVQGRLKVVLHCGDPRYEYSHPSKLRHILDEFPRLEVIAAHLGGWSMYDEALQYLRDKDCMLDISSSIMFMPKNEIYKYISAYGADRLLFGSDFPLWDPMTEIERFMQLDIDDDTKEKIAWKNAQRILNIKF